MMNLSAAVLAHFKTLVTQQGLSEDGIIFNENKGSNASLVS